MDEVMGISSEVDSEVEVEVDGSEFEREEVSIEMENVKGRGSSSYM
jgi:hypothetical protein